MKHGVGETNTSFYQNPRLAMPPDVTMYQRSSTHVVSTKVVTEVLLKGMYEEGGPPTELADLINASFPQLVMVQLGKRQVQAAKVVDK
jgi:hypothetical protein